MLDCCKSANTDAEGAAGFDPSALTFVPHEERGGEVEAGGGGGWASHTGEVDEEALSDASQPTYRPLSEALYFGAQVGYLDTRDWNR